MKLHASPLWDSDGNLHFKLFEHGKGSTPLVIYTDVEFQHVLDRLQEMLNIGKNLDEERKAVYDPLTAYTQGAVAAELGPDVRTLKMPDIVTNDERMIVIHWHVGAGDQVKVGDPLFEIESDKATNMVGASEPMRIIKTLIKAGADVRPGDAVLLYRQIPNW